MISIVVYILIGDPDSFLWGSYYFVTWNTVIFSISYLYLKSQRDRMTRILIQIFMGVTLSKILFNFFSFFCRDIFDRINKGEEIGVVVTCSVLIFIIYSYGRLAKK
jgi:hypothetical protein